MLHSSIILDEQGLEENMRSYLLELTDVLLQIICNIRIGRDPTTHGNHIDLKPIVKRIANILQLSFVSGDKGYDSSEDNHLLVRKDLCIPCNPSSIWTCPNIENTW